MTRPPWSHRIALLLLLSLPLGTPIAHGSPPTKSTTEVIIDFWNYKDPKNNKLVLVPYIIDPTIKAIPSRIPAINAAIAHMAKFTCVRFVPRTNQPNYIKFINGEGCYSNIGVYGGEQALSVGNGCDKKIGYILHDMTHALGFMHEDTRPDRDQFVTINLQNVKADARDQFAMVRDLGTQGLPYDYLSVMHHPPTDFSANGSPTITTKDVTFQHKIGQRNGLSPLDIQKINKRYKCETSAPAP
ncbi:MAG: hypothetical protein EOO71_08385 [Myxococcaceae bacterium]|nr:MAG: hypothetical protein EOO71_08385 [Myxococcaceae bacterium]